MDCFYVYAHYTPDSIFPFYIGKGQGKRAYTKASRNILWKRTVQKYGYRIKIMYDQLSESLALLLETELILKYGRKDIGCGPLVNLTNGGEGESGREFSKTHCQNISKAKRNKPSIRKGTVLTEEIKVKIRAARKKQIITSKHKEQIRNALKGRSRSEETCEKIRQTSKLRSKDKLGRFLSNI